MENQHPITPPSELLQLWLEQHHDYNKGINELLIEAVQYGADRELEACVDFVQYEADWDTAERLRADRRRKVPSLKERALDLVKPAKKPGTNVAFGPKELETIRRAIEALPND